MLDAILDLLEIVQAIERAHVLLQVAEVQRLAERLTDVPPNDSVETLESFSMRIAVITGARGSALRANVSAGLPPVGLRQSARRPSSARVAR